MLLLGISHLVAAIIGMVVGGIIGMFVAGSLLLGHDD